MSERWGVSFYPRFDRGDVCTWKLELTVFDGMQTHPLIPVCVCVCVLLSSLSSLKLECEKLASEKTEMQRHYIMVSPAGSPAELGVIPPAPAQRRCLRATKGSHGSQTSARGTKRTGRRAE